MRFENLNPENVIESALIALFKDCGVESEDEVFMHGDQFMIVSSDMYGAMLAGTIKVSDTNDGAVFIDVPVSLNGDPFIAVVKDGWVTLLHN